MFYFGSGNLQMMMSRGFQGKLFNNPSTHCFHFLKRKNRDFFAPIFDPVSIKKLHA